MEDLITISYHVEPNHPYFHLNNQPGSVNALDIAEGFDPDNVSFNFYILKNS